jgi:putative glutamine amidotransferase
MPAPLILIAPGTHATGAEFGDRSLSLSQAYPEAVIAAGGMPWLMPYGGATERIPKYVRQADGVLMTGGDDVQVGLYRQRVPPSLQRTVSPADPQRDWAEICLIEEVFRQRKPLLAICRGQQILNVAFGGTLYVDVGQECPGAINHCRMDRKNVPVHPVELAAGSLLAEVLGKGPIAVNSTHHQAVQKVAAPFRVTARSPDGVVEAMELGLAEGHLLPYLLAVQFHPERLAQRYPEFANLFRSFVRSCSSRKKQ